MTKYVRLTLTFFLAMLVTGCSSGDNAVDYADTIFVGGTIKTMNEAQPEAEAVAVRGDKIIFVGTSKDAQKLISDNTEVIDLTGKMLLPGFVDAHDHLGSGPINLGDFGLRQNMIHSGKGVCS